MLENDYIPSSLSHNCCVGFCTDSRAVKGSGTRYAAANGVNSFYFPQLSTTRSDIPFQFFSRNMLTLPLVIIKPKKICQQILVFLPPKSILNHFSSGLLITSKPPPSSLRPLCSCEISGARFHKRTRMFYLSDFLVSILEHREVDFPSLCVKV